MTQHIVCYPGLVGCSLGVLLEEYIPHMLTLVNDRTITEGVRAHAPMFPTEEVEFVRGLPSKKRTDQIFAVLRHDGPGEYSYIGHTGIHGIQWPNARGGTGSILGDTKVWEKGFGTEAKLLLQYHAFRVLGLRKLVSDVKGFNARSLGHLIKCGYRIVGRYTAHEFHDGAFTDQIILECFREDWENIWSAYQQTSKLPRLTEEERELVKRETNQE